LLQLYWSGPGFGKTSIPPSVFFQLPQITATIERTGEDQLTIEWNSTTGQTYRIRSESTLQAPRSAWSSVMDALISTPPTNAVVLGGPYDPSRFYAIEEE
jgi:hypothetical protein